MKLDKNRPYGRITSTDSEFKVKFIQDGIDYDKAGDPLDKKQLRAFNQSILDEAKKVADSAQAIADEAQAKVDAAQALLDSPDSPQTVAQLKTALDELGVQYSSKDNKSDLEQLWMDAQAG